MPESADPMYSVQEIEIPIPFPEILKSYTKAAIRTQPKDLLKWSAAYFDALAKGDRPPVKEYYETTGQEATESGLTIGTLRTIYRQLHDIQILPLEDLRAKWEGLCLDPALFADIVEVGEFVSTVESTKFIAIASSELGENLTDTMRVLCEVMSLDGLGIPVGLPHDVFVELYTYLAGIDGVLPQTHVNDVLKHLSTCAERQDGMIYPRNFISMACPPLF